MNMITSTTHCAISIVVTLALISSCLAQRADQYKRVHQRALKLIVDNQPDAAIEQLSKFTERYPDDAESYYMLAVANAGMGDKEKAIGHVREALRLGLSPGRFVGGSLTGLEALRELEAIEWLARVHCP